LAAEPLINKLSCPDTPYRRILGIFACLDYDRHICYAIVCNSELFRHVCPGCIINDSPASVRDFLWLTPTPYTRHPPKLLDDVRKVSPPAPLPIHTERPISSGSCASSGSYHAVARRPLSRRAHIEAFLTDLAHPGNGAAATHNQAMMPWCFSISASSNHALEDRINAVAPTRKINVPVVMTRDEVATVSR